MKAWKGTAVAFIVVVGLVTYAYLVEFKGTEQKEIAKQEASRILQFSLDEVESLRVTQPQDSFELSRKGPQWVLSGSVQDAADANGAEAFIQSLLDEKSEESLKDPAPDLNIYGLKDPQARFTFKLKSGEERELWVGNQNISSKIYLKSKGQDAILMGNYIWNTYAGKRADELRDLVLYKSKARELSEITIEDLRSKRRVRLTRTEAAWSFQEPQGLRLDTESVQKWIETLQGLRGVAVVAEDSQKSNELDKWSLKNPDLRARVKFSDGKEEVQLLGAFSDPKRGAAYFVTSEMPRIYEIPRATLEGLLKGPSDFRDRREPFEFDSNLIRSVKIKAGGMQLALKKGQQGWVAEGGKPGELNVERIESLVKKLSEAKAKEFPNEKPRGLTPPVGTIALSDETGKALLSFDWGAENNSRTGLFARTNRTKEPLLVEASFISTLGVSEILKKTEGETKKQ